MLIIIMIHHTHLLIMLSVSQLIIKMLRHSIIDKKTDPREGERAGRHHEELGALWEKSLEEVGLSAACVGFVVAGIN